MGAAGWISGTSWQQTFEVGSGDVVAVAVGVGVASRGACFA